MPATARPQILTALVVSVGLAGCTAPPARALCGVPSGQGLASSVELNGSLTVHLDQVDQDVFVFVGDGSRLVQNARLRSEVTFADPSLKGPQRVTLMTGRSNDPCNRVVMQVFTIEGVNRPDLHLPWELTGFAPERSQTLPTIRADVQLLDAGSSRAIITARGDGYYGQGSDSSAGRFEFPITVTSACASDVTIFAQRDGPEGTTLGVVAGLTPDAGRVEASLALDTPVNHEVALRLENTGSFGTDYLRVSTTVVAAGFDYSVATSSFISRRPASVSIVGESGRWSGFRWNLLAELGDPSLPLDHLYARTVVDASATSATIGFLAPSRLIQPPTIKAGPSVSTCPGDPFLLGASDHRPLVDSRTLQFAWESDARATMHVLDFQLGSLAPVFNWRVVTPGGAREFVPYELPEQAMARTLPGGDLSVNLGSYELTASYDDFYGASHAREWAEHTVPALHLSSRATTITGYAKAR